MQGASSDYVHSIPFQSERKDMQRHSTVVPATMIIVLVLALAGIALAQDPHVGTWKMNPAKSKFSPGPPPKSDTIIFTTQDNGIKLMEEIAEANGDVTHIEFAAKYDGKDYPITGDPNIDTIAVRKIDANTFDVVFKKAGKEMFKAQEVFSKDGKTFTFIEKGKNAKGRINNTIVCDKQ